MMQGVHLGAVLSSDDFGSSVERRGGGHPVYGDDEVRLLLSWRRGSCRWLGRWLSGMSETFGHGVVAEAFAGWLVVQVAAGGRKGLGECLANDAEPAGVPDCRRLANQEVGLMSYCCAYAVEQ